MKVGLKSDFVAICVLGWEPCPICLVCAWNMQLAFNFSHLCALESLLLEG